MTVDQDDWKQRYKQLALEHEQLQKTLDEQRRRNRSLSGQLGLGLRGQSSALDAELEALNELLKENAQPVQLDKIYAGIERQIRLLDEQRFAVTRDIRGAVERWLAQLRDLSRSESFSNLLRNVERRVPDAVENLYKLAALLLEMVELQKGLVPKAVVGAAPDAAFALSDHDEGALDLELLESRIASEMLKLIEALSVEASGVELARSLIRRIEAGIKAADLPELMGELVQLARLSAGLEHEEFENYLLNLNEQLAYVQQFLVQSQAEERQYLVAQQQLDQQVRQDVHKLHHSVKESTDLLSLKRAVALQLRSIVQAMDDYRAHEGGREDRLQQRYDALLNKVEQMEVEAARVKSKIEEEQLRARTDPLTGLPNRAAYSDSLQAELGRWQRYGTVFSIAVIDLDLFKAINDSYGHLAGDKVLRLVARVLRNNLRGTDFIARYGGEEFVAIFPSTDQREAKMAAEKLREAVAGSPFNFRGQPVKVTASIGVAQVEASDDADQLFARADQSLYLAKNGGRDRVMSA